MQSLKEGAANVAASAKSGMEKTKATVQEKVERMTAHNPTQKEIATEKKETRIHNAELNKQQAKEHNSAAKTGGAYSHTATGMMGQSTGGHQMSALPGHGTGEPAGAYVTEGTVQSHPVGAVTGTGRPTTAHNTHVGGGAGPGYGTGGGYSG